jgi:adenylyl-sulfate kinase
LFTGLSGSGKSTLAIGLEDELFKRGYKVFLLDGDNVRTGISSNLGFSYEDRAENVRRVAEVAKLFVDAGIIVLAALISPLRSNREKIKATVGAERYVEIFVDAPIELCEERDSKGLYKRARVGHLKDFTGIDSPYERPDQPDVTISVASIKITEAVQVLLKIVEDKIKFQ